MTLNFHPKTAGIVKVVIDTNIWISYLIGKTLKELQKLMDHPEISIVITSEMVSEIKETFERKHLVKYFKDEQFSDFWNYLDKLNLDISVENIPQICRDKDDNFLLALAEQSNCNFIITGDKDLLVIKEYQGIKIIRFRDFMTSYYHF
jgi:uncharacterized protein